MAQLTLDTEDPTEAIDPRMSTSEVPPSPDEDDISDDEDEEEEDVNQPVSE